jgi:HEAT repeat protein
MAIKMLGDADPTVRVAASDLLAAAPTPAGIGPLVEQLGVAYEPLHLSARAALLASGPLTIDAAVKLLDHADPRRREDGSYLLGELRNDAALQRHIALMDDKDWGVVRQAAWSLGLIGRTEAIPAIAKLAAQ